MRINNLISGLDKVCIHILQAPISFIFFVKDQKIFNFRRYHVNNIKTISFVVNSALKL